MIDVTIKKEVNDQQLSQALEIYYEAFKRKIKPLIKSKEIACNIYKKSINKNRIIYALVKDEVVGFVGLQYCGKNFMEIKYKTLREYMNPVKSFFVFLIYKKVLLPKIKANEMRIDSLAVKSKYRSKGIGSKLINEVFLLSRNLGLSEIILEVVNTNPKAKKLYEKIGFVEKKHVRYFFITRKAGFTSEYIMSYNLN